MDTGGWQTAPSEKVKQAWKWGQRYRYIDKTSADNKPGTCTTKKMKAGLSGGVYFPAHQLSLYCGVIERWMTLLSFGGWHACWPDSVPVSALWRVVRGFASVGLFVAGC
jgi:hypothetical protein